MRYTNIGINVDSVDKLILDIYNYAEKINKTLNQISDIMDQTRNNCLLDEINILVNKFESFKANFPVVNKNLISYANDLIILKNKYQNIDMDLTQKVKMAITKVDNK